MAGHGLGTRSQRYAMVVDDGVVKTLNVEDAPGKADVSGADKLLKAALIPTSDDGIMAGLCAGP